MAKVPHRTTPWTITILGECASKSNSRRLVSIRGAPAFIKSVKAAKYCDDFRRQCPILDPMFTGDLHLDIDIIYSTRRPDLDESLILDCLQGRAYENDRAVKSRRTRWGWDPFNPRAIITIRPVQLGDLAGE